MKGATPLIPSLRATLLRLSANIAFALPLGAACFGQHYVQLNLVSDTVGAARITDPQFINPWGISRSARSAWLVGQGNGGSTVHNGAGASTEDHIETVLVSLPTSRSEIHAHITSTPPGADIQVDGTYVGITPLDVDLPCCFHDVTISKPGRRPWTGRVRNNGHAEIHAQLPKARINCVHSEQSATELNPRRCEPWVRWNLSGVNDMSWRRNEYVRGDRMNETRIKGEPQ
jgi:hypothetical protein